MGTTHTLNRRTQKNAHFWESKEDDIDGEDVGAVAIHIDYVLFHMLFFVRIPCGLFVISMRCLI